MIIKTVHIGLPTVSDIEFNSIYFHYINIGSASIVHRSGKQSHTIDVVDP